MTRTASAAATIALAALAASTLPSEAATVLPYGGGVGQHRTVMNNIAGVQRRNNAVINHVQDNIRAAQRRRY